MSLDINFDKSIPLGKIESKTTLKVVKKDGNNFLEDQYGNIVFFKDYGITLYGGPRNPFKILDELVNAFGIMFIDNDSIDKYYYEPEKYKDVDLFTPTMIEYGYTVVNGTVTVPEREESEYLPYNRTEVDDNDSGDSDLPF